jgi:hypothetical protein
MFAKKVGKTRLEKPFVEKPLDADDHNIYVYYPSSTGGGCRRLFRKEGDRSSEYDADGMSTFFSVRVLTLIWAFSDFFSALK